MLTPSPIILPNSTPDLLCNRSEERGLARSGLRSLRRLATPFTVVNRTQVECVSATLLSARSDRLWTVWDYPCHRDSVQPVASLIVSHTKVFRLSERERVTTTTNNRGPVCHLTRRLLCTRQDNPYISVYL